MSTRGIIAHHPVNSPPGCARGPDGLLHHPRTGGLNNTQRFNSRLSSPPRFEGWTGGAVPVGLVFPLSPFPSAARWGVLGRGSTREERWHTTGGLVLRPEYLLR